VPSTLLSRFFNLYDQWSWSSTTSSAPVLLCELSSNNTLPFKTWSPYHHNKRRVMPIITPSYPSMNTTHNVGASTLKVMQGEIRRGKSICDALEKEIEAKARSVTNGNGKSDSVGWQKLFDRSELFDTYTHYLQIDVYADDLSAFIKWNGFVESRLRLLVYRLEDIDCIGEIRPYPIGYTDNPVYPPGAV